MERAPTLLSEPIHDPQTEFWKSKGAEEYGLYLLRKNYRLQKPSTKYTEDHERPRDSRIQYSNLTDELVKKNPKHPNYFFHETTRSKSFSESKRRHFVERHVDLFSKHVIRGPTLLENYCYIRKDAYDKNVPIEYTYSPYEAKPTWGEANTGFRTRSHHIAEPVERFTNIDLYRRSPTNQPGRIIFDNGRPNNGYYLQRNQYNNTWFNSNLVLNKTDVLQSIAPKTNEEYEYIRMLEEEGLRTKSSDWPHVTEYQDKIILHSATCNKTK